MSIERKVEIDGKEWRMRASALIPRLYRVNFGRDMITDMNKLMKDYHEAQKRGDDIPINDLTIFENCAWAMLKNAGEDVGDTPDEWLENLDGIFSVYEAMPVIAELWQATQMTTSKPRKK